MRFGASCAPAGAGPARTTIDRPGVDDRVITWSHGRRFRTVAADVPGDDEHLLEAVASGAAPLQRAPRPGNKGSRRRMTRAG